MFLVIGPLLIAANVTKFKGESMEMTGEIITT
jgi:hypothetical protein